MADPFSMIELLRGFVRKAADLGIEYMVTGSFAMSAYGEIRSMRDIDFVIDIGEQQVGPLVRAFTGDYYVNDNSVRRAITDRSMFNIVDISWGTKIDCIVRNDTDFARKCFERRRKAIVSGVEFWIATKEDLILSKLLWVRDTHSEMQIRDIANLTSTEYDSEYVDAWIGSMGLSPIWGEVERWKIQRQRSES